METLGILRLARICCSSKCSSAARAVSFASNIHRFPPNAVCFTSLLFFPSSCVFPSSPLWQGIKWRHLLRGGPALWDALFFFLSIISQESMNPSQGPKENGGVMRDGLLCWLLLFKSRKLPWKDRKKAAVLKLEGGQFSAAFHLRVHPSYESTHASNECR